MLQESQGDPDCFMNQRIVPSIILITVGGIFLLANLHLVRMRDLWQYWPVILMVVGVFRLVDAESSRERTLGGLLLMGGSIALAGNLGLIAIHLWDLWPLLLIGAGIYMLVERTTGGHRFPVDFAGGPKAAPPQGPWIRHETALFSGGKRKIAVDNFYSAKYDAVFGGFEVDLRGSQIQGESASIEINAFCGGAEVKVPRNWMVVMEGMGIFGGFADSTEHPEPDLPNIKRLYVRGYAIFGGAEIKN
ncbi:MAG TPA: DUF5668 domain-containing protein [Bryobacteraceae bacterium]|nr:DUF5668 domain-containing protein [Bryobacteraceae bacterium]